MLSSKAVAYALQVADKMDKFANELYPITNRATLEHVQAVVTVFTAELAALYDRVLLLESNAAYHNGNDVK